MKKILFLLAIFLGSFSCFSKNTQFGIVVLKNKNFCASFGENPPPIGSTITLLETQSPQYFFTGKLDSENNLCNFLEGADVAGPYFLVTNVKKFPFSFIGVAVFSEDAFTVKNNQVILNSLTSKKQIRFRSCFSNEGINFSSWSGIPQKNERLWEKYYYLGYDIEANCQKNNF